MLRPSRAHMSHQWAAIDLACDQAPSYYVNWTPLATNVTDAISHDANDRPTRAVTGVPGLKFLVGR